MLEPLPVDGRGEGQEPDLIAAGTPLGIIASRARFLQRQLSNSSMVVSASVTNASMPANATCPNGSRVRGRRQCSV